MAIEKRFIQEGLKKAQMNEYFIKKLSRAGYGGMEINRTSMGTQITLYAENPGMVIGKGGRTIRKITRELDNMFDLDNPQIDVQEVPKPELNAQMMANRLANALERGWYFRKAGHTMLRRIMDAGALGCEIILSGKVTGPRSRVEKFIDGYIKHAGHPSEELVDEGFAVAVKKLGTIGVKVRIVPPDVELPDDFQIEELPPVEEPEEEAEEAETVEAEAEAEAEEEKEGIEELLEEEEKPSESAEAEASLEEAEKSAEKEATEEPEKVAEKAIEAEEEEPKKAEAEEAEEEAEEKESGGAE